MATFYMCSGQIYKFPRSLLRILFTTNY